MFIVRNVFRCKPGKAKNVLDKFKAAFPLMEGVKQRLLVDEVGGFWTVVVEVEAEDMGAFEKLLKDRGSRQDVQDAMSGYMDFIESGYREIYRVVA
jgi:hypothetical protein